MNVQDRNWQNISARSAGIFLTVGLLFFISSQPSLAQQESVKRIIVDFDAIVEAEINTEDDGCLMVAVFKGDEMIWSKLPVKMDVLPDAAR